METMTARVLAIQKPKGTAKGEVLDSSRKFILVLIKNLNKI